jgi:hypothetical protein
MKRFMLLICSLLCFSMSVGLSYGCAYVSTTQPLSPYRNIHEMWLFAFSLGLFIVGLGCLVGFAKEKKG